MHKKIVTIFLVFLIILLSLGIYYLYTNHNYVVIEEVKEDKYIELLDKSKQEAEELNLQNIEKAEKTTSELTQLSYKDYHDKLEFTDDLRTYQIADISDIPQDINSEMENLRIQNTQGVILTEKTISDLLAMLKKITKLNTVIVDKSFLGNSGYVDLLKALKTDYQVLTEIPAKWNTYINYENLARFEKSYSQEIDYSQISQNSDYVILSAYDYTNQNSILAGPIAPLGWVEQVVKYAIYKGLPREKIILSIPTYGYEWSDVEVEYTYEQNYVLTEAVAKKIQVTELDNIAGIFDERTKETKYIAGDKIIFYLSTEDIQKRVELAASFGLAGVMLVK